MTTLHKYGRLPLMALAMAALTVSAAQAQAPGAPVTLTPGPGAPSTATPPPGAPAGPPALPPPSPLAQAFEKAAGDVLKTANVPPGTRVDLLIDPLVDGTTGIQSTATRTMEGQLRRLIAAKYGDKFQVKPFTAENVAANPFVFIGTFTPIYATAQTAGPKDAYRICFAILDLKSKLIASKGFARATPAGINAQPTSAFQEAPVWVHDPSVEGYIKTCQGTKAGQPINPVYLERIGVASVVADAIDAYDHRRYAKALELYQKARALPGGDQLRVFNGLYLANLKLGHKADADKALTDLIGYGMQGDRLGVLMLFSPNTTAFAPIATARYYPAWLKAIAGNAEAHNSCLEVIGHASHTGGEAYNDKLSAERAAAIQARLAKVSARLTDHAKSSGKGFHENLVGTGRDNATDALDRRVEFKIAKCS